jgi:hypothetical protein
VIGEGKRLQHWVFGLQPARLLQIEDVDRGLSSVIIVSLTEGPRTQQEWPSYQHQQNETAPKASSHHWLLLWIV